MQPRKQERRSRIPIDMANIKVDCVLLTCEVNYGTCPNMREEERVDDSTIYDGYGGMTRYLDVCAARDYLLARRYLHVRVPRPLQMPYTSCTVHVAILGR